MNTNVRICLKIRLKTQSYFHLIIILFYPNTNSDHQQASCRNIKKVTPTYAWTSPWQKVTNTLRNMFYSKSLTKSRNPAWWFIMDLLHYEVSQKHSSNWLDNCTAIKAERQHPTSVWSHLASKSVKTASAHTRAKSCLKSSHSIRK